MSEILFARLDELTAVAAGAQPLDATLTALAGLDAVAGFVVQTGTDTFVKRTLTAPAEGFSITNPAGTAGDPTFVLENDLEALEALSSTGIAVRSATDTWVQRSLTAPVAGFTITNPAGIAGNFTFALSDDLSALEGLGATGFAVRTALNTWEQRSIAGTANEITFTNGDGVSGNATASLPATLTFTGKTVTGGTFTNITLNLADNVFSIQDNGDPTKQLRFEVSGITTGTIRTLTMFDASDTLVGLTAGQTLTNKTITLANNAISGTTAQFNTALSDNDFATLAGSETLTNKTIGAATLSGTIAGGGNQINNVIIGTTTPLAGSFTTLSASTSVSTPIYTGAAAVTFQSNGSTFAGDITTGQQWYLGGTLAAPQTGPVLTVSNNTTAVSAVGTPGGISSTAQLLLNVVGNDTNGTDVIIQTFNNTAAGVRYMSAAGTNASKTATTATSLGVNFAYGYTGSVYVSSVGFVFTATETYSGTNSGGRLDLYATPTGTTGIAIAASVGAGFMVGTTTDPGAGNAKFAGWAAVKSAVTFTGTSGTVGTADAVAIFNPSGSFTVTLPAASAANAGRQLYVKTIAAQTVSSASSNVIPLTGGAAGTAILAATAGRWALLHSNGTNWEIIFAN